MADKKNEGAGGVERPLDDASSDRSLGAGLAPDPLSSPSATDPLARPPSSDPFGAPTDVRPSAELGASLDGGAGRGLDETEKSGANATSEPIGASATLHRPFGSDASTYSSTVRPVTADPIAVDPPASDPAEPRRRKRGWSFAARALTFLILLLAGAALGVWAAPRVAPHLPAGLAPVASWLTPGAAEAEAERAELENRIAALESGLGDVTTQVSAAPTTADLEARVGALVDAARTELSAEIASLRDALEQSNITQASERIGRLESSLEGATTELASLRDQIAAGAGAADEATAASIDAYRSELDGLRAEVGGLSGSISGLGSRLDEAIASAEARVADAEAREAEARAQAETVQQTAVVQRNLAAAQADVATVRAALASGAPFADALSSLETNAQITTPIGLSAAASSGVQTLPELRASFSDAAHEAIRATITADAEGGVLARSRAFLQAQVASRSLSPQEGSDPDAVLSRMEDALRRDDLQGALDEASALSPEAQAAMSDWLAAARLRAEAEAGLSEVETSTATTN